VAIHSHYCANYYIAGHYTADDYISCYITRDDNARDDYFTDYDIAGHYTACNNSRSDNTTSYNSRRVHLWL